MSDVLSTTVVPAHVAWLVDTSERFETADGHVVEVWELRYGDDSAVLKSWASHFRNQYCDDGLIDVLRAGTGKSRADFLIQDRFPDAKESTGPITRSGDFAEILLTDYVEFLLGYWCPRMRNSLRWNIDASTQGSDIVGFKIIEDGKHSPSDELIVMEVKAALTGKPVNKLEEAVKDSCKDDLRYSTNISAMKQRFIERGDFGPALKLQRYQDYADRPYKMIHGAAAVLSNSAYDVNTLAKTKTSMHKNQDNLKLIVVKGETLMTLVHALYERAANEA